MDQAPMETDRVTGAHREREQRNEIASELQLKSNGPRMTAASSIDPFHSDRDGSQPDGSVTRIDVCGQDQRVHLYGSAFT